MTLASASGSTSTPDLATSLHEALRDAIPGLTGVGGLKRLSGGSSHETWAFDATREHAGDPAPATLPLILRREFNHALFDMSIATECALLSRLHAAGLPVARPLTQGGGRDGPLATPFMVIERINGTDARKAMAARGPESLHRVSLGAALVAAQARIHALDAQAFTDLLPMPSAGLNRDIDRWAAIIAAAPRSGPSLALALDWLAAHDQPIEHPVIVHGDYKANNILLGPDDAPVIIDWELAHIGDRVDDLAWTMLWASGWDLVGGILTPEAYIAAYEQASGQTICRQRLHAAKIAALVKLAAIFFKGLEQPPGAPPPRPQLLMLGQAIPCIDQAILRLLMAPTRQERAA